MPEIKTDFLFTIALEVEVFNLGDTPYGSRRVARFGTAASKDRSSRGRCCRAAAAGCSCAATTC